MSNEQTNNLDSALRALPKVKFTLPVHAHLGGCRHLGGGEFVAFEPQAAVGVVPEPYVMQAAPTILQLVRDEAEVFADAPGPHYDPIYTLHPYVDPLDSAESKVRFIALSTGPDPVDAALAKLANVEAAAVTASIQLTPAEVQSGLDRVRWAELLIKQLPADHDGRNSWLLNYGRNEQGQPTPETFPGEDRVAVPRGLIGAACAAINRKSDGGNVLAELRRYTVGDLSTALSAAPDAEKAAQLLSIVQTFIDKYRISCPETIHQTDRVIENAYGFIEDLANVAGYYRYPDEEAAP